MAGRAEKPRDGESQVSFLHRLQCNFLEHWWSRSWTIKAALSHFQSANKCHAQ